ncbi:MAG: hypothetical protein ACRD82_15990, partial [Blastocatellia bacterium]
QRPAGSEAEGRSDCRHLSGDSGAAGVAKVCTFMIVSPWVAFTELIRTPFQHMESVWGVVPLYFGLLLNEMTSAKASFRTAIQTGFSFVWAATQWLYPYFRPHAHGLARLDLGAMLPVNLGVTFLVLAFGLAALVSGFRQKYPKGCVFLGHTRFANYFMIAIFPIQARVLEWTWERLMAIAVFAIPVWLLMHFGLMPVRNRK